MLILFLASLIYLNQSSAISGVSICGQNYPCGSTVFPYTSDGVCPETYGSGTCSPYDKDCSPCALTDTSCGYCSRQGISCCGNCHTSDKWYCNGVSVNTREYRFFNSCQNFACAYQVTSSEDCLAKASTDSDGSSTAYTTAGTVTDYTGCSLGSCTINSYPDSCSGSTLTEYGASGTTFTSTTKNCNDYDTNSCRCTTGSNLNELCHKWGCTSNACQDTNTEWTRNSYTCSAANQCAAPTTCQGSSYKCYRTNSGSWNWAASPESSETNCNDGYDNDCNGYIDLQDANCQLILTMNPNPAYPARSVNAVISPSTPLGNVAIKDYLGCSSGTTLCTIPTGQTSCPVTAPSNPGTFGYHACIGQNDAYATLSVTSADTHCSNAFSHTQNDNIDPARYLHYYTIATTKTWNTDDCDALDTKNCRNSCNTGTGNIDYICDDYRCISSACSPTGSTFTQAPNNQVCTNSCTGKTAVSFQTTNSDLIKTTACSAGQASCPSTTMHDSCSGDIATQNYCSGASALSSTKNCNDYDGWYCSGNVREYRNYGCFDPGAPSGAYCKYSVTSSEDCAAKQSIDSDGSPTAYTTAGTVTDYTGCSLGSCTSSSYPDSCSAQPPSLLTEYGASGSTFSSANYDCKNFDSKSCSNGNQYEEIWSCKNSPGFCYDTATQTPVGTDSDTDGVDVQCGDTTCDNAKGVCDTAIAGKCIAKTSTETNCADGLDNDCNGLTDCADLGCAGQTGPNAAKCCQTSSNCVQSNCVTESCANNICTYANRNACDSTECSAGTYCDSAGGTCKSPEQSENVCLNCAQVTDKTTGLWNLNPPIHEDAGKGYSTNADLFTSLFNSDGGPCTVLSGGVCFDKNNNPSNHKSALTTGNCCGNDLNEYFKKDWHGGECTNSVDDCVWSSGDAQSSDTGNKVWWCYQHEWSECKDTTIGSKIGGVTCAGVVGNNAWTPNSLVKNENLYGQNACSDGIDNDGNGLTDCQDNSCDGSVTGNVRNQNSQSISSATITAKIDIQTASSVQSSQQGFYSIGLHCGNYNLVASHPDYASSSQSISIAPNQQLSRDFSLLLGSSCEQDCTYVSDNIVHASCDGKNGCAFYDSIAKAACDNSQPGWVRDYNATHYITCALGTPQPKIELQASISCSSGTLVKVTRIVVYNGKPVKLVVATCG